VAIAITALIVGVIVMSIFQIFIVNALSSNHMKAVRQVQNAGYWINHDVQMAQSVAPAEAPDIDGFPLTLIWTEWEGDEHQVIYVYDTVGDRLQREHYTNYDTDDPDEPDSTIFVAEYIQSIEVAPRPFTGGELTLTVTATVGTWPQVETETRVYEIVPRPS